LPHLRRRNTIYDDRFPIPTFDEVLALRARLTAELGRQIGVYPETKHPSHFRSIGLELETPLVAALDRAGLSDAASPLFIQSFEWGSLARLRAEFGVATGLIFLTGASGSPVSRRPGIPAATPT
jgi:glycerophosphoryl diester phosphodiesterase